MKLLSILATKYNHKFCKTSFISTYKKTTMTVTNDYAIGKANHMLIVQRKQHNKGKYRKCNKCKTFISDTEKANPVPRQAHRLDLMSAQHSVFKHNYTFHSFIQYNVYQPTCIKAEL